MSYPINLASDVVLRDGSTVALRPVRPDDAPLLLDFFRSLDERSLAFRFFTGAPDLDDVAQILADVDYERRFGLVALRGDERRPVGHGFFAAIDDQIVEVAFAVSRALQGHGLGSVLLAQLAERAAEGGFERMVADVLPENHAMVSMFRHSGFPVEVRAEPGSLIVEMPTSPEPEAIARFQERDAAAARAAVAAFFDPGTVTAIDGPPEATLEWAERSADAIRAVVVRGAPQAWGEHGAAVEHDLLEICRRAGARLIGPASFGVLDNRPGRTLDLTASAELPPHGGVGIVTQGADAGRALLDGAVRRGVGVSTFVSLGARADVTANDLLEYWEEDPATEVALLQVESFSDPRRFARVARRVGAGMPIVVIAERAAAEPPGLGLFDQVGAVRAVGVDQALDLAVELAAADAPRRRPSAPARAMVPRSDEAAAILATALSTGDDELDQASVVWLLDCYGITVGEPPRRSNAAALLRIAVETDPLFGPVLRCGPAEAPAAEQAARLCPLAAGDAAELLDRMLLEDPTLGAFAARRPLECAVEGAAAAAAAHAEIAALDLEPLALTPRGAVTPGARVLIHRPPERRPWPRTWE
ncbi:MAG: GNAT family N-acetyltransferase [Actinobacteria bacterium]|nr:GNAT family N-acetyltransferase [Actinomycetota bacterium]